MALLNETIEQCDSSFSLIDAAVEPNDKKQPTKVILLRDAVLSRSRSSFSLCCSAEAGCGNVVFLSIVLIRIETLSKVSTRAQLEAKLPTLE